MGSIAPLISGWTRRVGGRPGPLGPVSGGTGEGAVDPAGVELLIDGQWQLITSSVMTRDGSQNIAITRGQQNEGATVQPGTCSFQLNNRGGCYSPRNPTSPLYGKIGRNTQLRVYVPRGDGRSYRFCGEVPEWPQDWDTTGNDAWVAMSAAGPLRRLAQGNSLTGSAMKVSLGVGQTTNQVVAYWPLEDAVGSSTLASAVAGVSNMTFSGIPTLATNSEFICSSALPTMGTAAFTATVPSYSPPGGLGGIGVNPFGTAFRFLVKIPQAGATSGQVLLSWTWTGSIPVWEVYYSTSGGGTLGLRGKTSAGAVVQDTGLGGPALNGQLAHVTATLDQSGGILFEFGLSILIVGSSSPSGPSGTAFGPIPGIVQSVAMAPGRGLPDTVMGHLSLQLSTSTPLTDTAAVASVLVAHAGESAAARIQRLAGIAGMAFELIGSASDTVLLGAQLPGKVLDLINAAVASDGGCLYEQTSQLGLGYRTRTSFENQAAAVTLSYTGNNLAEVPRPQDDDAYTRNDVTVTRSGGTSSRATLTTGALSTQNPPNGVGQYDDSVQLSLATDAQTLDLAWWRLHLGTVDEQRFPKLAINLAHASIVNSPTIRNAALAVRFGDRVVVTDLPPQLPPGQISQLALGSSEMIDNFQHRITWNSRPESPFRVAVTDDPVYGRVDTDGSQLAADVGPADTTLSVAVTAGPLWTTSAPEFPFDVLVGGEQITVTNITGSSSPQTFTVTRSVNGVSKPQATGADVRLFQPATIAL